MGGTKYMTDTTENTYYKMIEHETYGKLALRRNYDDIKTVAKRKFKVLSQDNEKEIVYIQMEDTQEIIPMTFSVMIYLLRNY
jgi:hypothetical protein